MADIKIKQTSVGGDYSTETYFEANGYDYLNEDLIKALFGGEAAGDGPKNCEKALPVEVAQPIVRDDGVKEETVVIYDDFGIPSIMRKFSRVTNAELFGGSDKPHPAFVIGGEVYDEIYISVYPNTEINGKPYSLPFMKPWTSIANDDAARACFAKGAGWHMMTAAEWGLVANISLKNGTLPHGNTASGKYHADPSECGEVYEYGRTLAGSGPATWTHNHQPDGVHDLCGNIWEMLRGMRVRNGMPQTVKDNDAAMDIDLSLDGEAWCAVRDDAGEKVRFSVNDEGEIAITSTPETEDTEHNYDGCEWSDAEMDCESEQLHELALFDGEPNAYLYVNSTVGEYFPFRGGYWYGGTNAGVFSTYFYYARTFTSTVIGFRSAFYKKH